MPTACNLFYPRVSIADCRFYFEEVVIFTIYLCFRFHKKQPALGGHVVAVSQAVNRLVQRVCFHLHLC